MPKLTISTTTHPPVPALTSGAQLATRVAQPSGGRPLILHGRERPADASLACLAVWALVNEQPVVLQPANVPAQLAGTAITTAASGVAPAPEAACEWRVAMYTSGSTGPARAFGFTGDQLNRLAAWYTTIYQVTPDSVICTHLPVTYNFTFVAGLMLAHALGARLHLAASARAVFTDAPRLAGAHDRCVVLANPLLLAEPPPRRLADNVLIDSGGAPLSAHAISTYRERFGDLREGYGLTETGSLTHFDHTAEPAALGTVGAGLPGVHTRITDVNGVPRIALTTPACGTPLKPCPPGATEQAQQPAPIAAGQPPVSELLTTDVGRVDVAGRLRLLGRADDRPVGGLWPRDVLDLIGPHLGTAPATIAHPADGTVRIRVHHPLPSATIGAITARVAEQTGIDPRAVRVDTANRRLHSDKLPRPTDLQPALTEGP